MGWSCSWIAVRGKPKAALLPELGLRPSGNYQDQPEAEWSGAALSDGWYLVFSARDCEPRQFKPSALAIVSRDCELVASSVEEHVMFCSSAYWNKGSRAWSIVHDAQRGIEHLAVDGSPPASYPSIRDRYLAQQDAEGGSTADVDLVFEIPLVIGVELTAFRHDQTFPKAEPRPFEALVMDVTTEASTRKKSWWKVW